MNVAFSMILDKIHRHSPLVHILPNSVSAAFCADAVTALGARPIMALSPKETGQITTSASSLVVNLGQPSQEKLDGILTSLSAAEQRNIPVVFDPVGAGASDYRKACCQTILSAPWNGMIKGNRSEITALFCGRMQYNGVDSREESIEPSLLPSAQRVLFITGPEDLILWKGKEAHIRHKNMEPMNLVGAGCVLGCLCGAVLAVEKDPFAAAVFTSVLMSYIGGQIYSIPGYGSRKLALLDGLSRISPTELAIYGKEVLRIEGF